MRRAPPWEGPPGLRLELLGGFRVTLGDRRIEPSAWRLRKAAALIKLLALAPGRRLHREQVMDALWPDLAPPAAANNLRYVLHVARRTLDPDPAAAQRYLWSNREQIALCPDDAYWSDLDAVEAAAVIARAGHDPAAYQRALDYYGGELLPDDPFEEWAARRREQVSALYSALLVELASLYESRRQLGQAVEALRRAVAFDPLHEEAQISLMRLYAETGRRRDAIRQFEQLSETLRRELDAEPQPAGVALYQAILAGTVAAAPVVEPPPAGNLPAALSSFVGRQREQTEIRQLLASARLLTLTGSGGCGKTRLALQIATGLATDFEGGAWLVELAALTDPALVSGAVAAVLGVREAVGRPIAESIRDLLRTRRLLLVLDNCEHLVAACASLVNELLRGCPGLTVLATSRTRLRLTGEVVWPVPPLAPTDARQLFVERATAASPGFSLSQRTADQVHEICRRLDGIPLALELAASRVATMSVQQIAGRLDDRFRLLTAGDPSALPRQQTLRATLDWSHELLTQSERNVLRRLAAFSGGFELDAVEIVTSDDGITVADVAELLTRLVDSSLVVVDNHGAAGRYHLMETVQRYAEDQLDRMGETVPVRTRHQAYFTELADRLQLATLGGPDHKRAMDQLELEHDNLRAALAWAAERGDAVGELRLAASLGRFWEVCGRLHEARRRLESALAAGGGAPPAVYAWALNAAGRIALAQGALRTAAGYFARSLALYQAAEDRLGTAVVRLGQGALATLEADYDRAVTYCEEALTLFRELQQPLGIGAALIDLGIAENLRGNDTRGVALLQDGLAELHAIGDRRGAAWALIDLGKASQRRGDSDAARGYLEDGLALCRELGDRLGTAHALVQLGNVARGDGERSAAGAAPGYRGFRLRLVARLDGDPARAAALYREALTMYRQIGARFEMADCIEGLACVAAVCGGFERALRLAAAATVLRETDGLPLPPIARDTLHRALESARHQVGAAAAAAAWAAGRALSLDQAITEALSERDGALVLP